MKVTKSFQGNSAESSVAVNELLIVKNAKSKITGILTYMYFIVHVFMCALMIKNSYNRTITNHINVLPWVRDYTFSELYVFLVSVVTS